PWRSNVVFVADDTGEFEQVQDEQINDFIVGTAHTYNRTYEGQIEAAHSCSPCPCPSCWPPDQVAAEMRDRILNQLDGNADGTRDIGPGAAILSYVGHGSWQNWGDNYSFVTTRSFVPDDVDALGNGTKLPLILAANCLSGG